ncbi:MAG: HesA/MoeB/ThiF family protein [Bacteroidia bacterium]|nr:HesA/MoeB/ThiF family protein [Bacteroidia bacterium]
MNHVETDISVSTIFITFRTMIILSDPEKLRYHRHLILEEIGEAGQTLIRNAKFLVVGAGGLGCPAIQYLTAAGAGAIGIVDDDVIEISNLQRQVFYGFNDIGKLKSIVAGTRMKRMNNFVNLVMINCRLNAQNALEIIAGYDVILDCTDNLESRYLINDACIILDKPMVHAAIHKYQGQVSVFNYRNGPSYRCLHPENAAANTGSATVLGIYSVISGIIGLMQANEALKIVTGAGDSLSGKLMIYNALQAQFLCIDIEKITDNFNRETIITRFNLNISKTL